MKAEDTSWLKEWYDKQEQKERLEDWYKNHEVDNICKPKTSKRN